MADPIATSPVAAGWAMPVAHAVSTVLGSVRIAFINSGILGHRSVARLLAECAAAMPGVEPTHVDLSADLTLFDRGIRRALSVALAPAQGTLANVDLRRWRQELNVGLLAARRLAAIEGDRAFDALHFHTQAAAYASVRRMSRTPSIVSIDTTQRLARVAAGSSLAQLSYTPNIAHDRRVFHAAAAITTTSQWAARDLVDHDPACAHKVHVLPYPVRPIADADWCDLRFTRAARGERPRALFIGGDFIRKGGDLLLEVWREAGFGDECDLDLVTDWDLSGVTLPPGVQQHRGVTAYSPAWRALWQSADVFVMPTRDEAFGMVYQEAASAALPAIGTRLNAIPEILRALRDWLELIPVEWTDFYPMNRIYEFLHGFLDFENAKRLIAYGLILIIMMIVRPDGLITRDALRRLRLHRKAGHA